MTEPHTPPSKPRSFTADSPFSLIGILIAGVVGLLLGGLIALWLL